MDIVIWIVQFLLAGMFLMLGVMKFLRSREEVLAQMGDRMGWVREFDQRQLHFIGLFEILGALGLVLPRLTGILPWLTPLAALGIALLMVGAATVHIRRNEPGYLLLNAVIFVLALVVAILLF